MKGKPFCRFGLLLLITGMVFSQCKDQGKKQESPGAVIIEAKDSVPKGLAAGDTAYGNASDGHKIVVLMEGTAIYLGAHSVIRLPKTYSDTADREIRLDGTAAFTVGQAAGKPLIIHTRNLNITVLADSRFAVDAFALSAGEEADVVSGKLLVTKSYHSSTDNEPETLGKGEMVMINRDIDLMEKETLKPEELAKVKEKW